MENVGSLWNELAMSVPSSPLRLALLLAIVGLATASGPLVTTDGVMQYRVAVSLAHGEGFAVQDPEAFRRTDYGGRTGLDGRYYAQFSPGLSLLYLPTVLAERVLGTPPAFLAALANLPVWMLLALLYESTLLRLGASPGPARTATWILALASPLLVYAKEDFSEPLAGLGILLMAEALLRDAPRPSDLLRAGAGLLLASLARTECATGGLALASLALAPGLSVRRRAGALLAASLPSALLLFYNLHRFGTPFDFGIPQTGTNAFHLSPGAIATAAYGLFLSPNKGLLFYFPAILLLLASPRARLSRAAALRITLLVVPLLAVHLSWHSWMGGWSWGPRRLVPLLPLACLPLPWAIERIERTHQAGRPSARVAAATIVSLSLFVQSLGVLVDFGHALTYAAPWRSESSPVVPKRAEILTWLDPRYSPMIDHLRLAMREEPDLLLRYLFRPCAADPHG